MRVIYGLFAQKAILQKDSMKSENTIVDRMIDHALKPTTRVLCLALLCLSHFTSTSTVRADEKIVFPEHDIRKMITPLADLEATVKISKVDSVELEKIGADLKASYAVRKLSFQYKTPDKLRLEGHSATRGSATMIMNGAMRYYEVSLLKMKKTENLEAKSGKRQSLLEYVGLISPGTLKFMQATYLKDDILDGANAEVYELKYLKEDRGSFYRVWIDPKQKNVLKREWLDGAGKLRAAFKYGDAKESAPGIWLPTQVEVSNGEGKSAAILTLSNIKVNQGMTDEPFQIAIAK